MKERHKVTGSQATEDGRMFSIEAISTVEAYLGYF